MSLSPLGGFRFEDMIVTTRKGGGELQEPAVAQTMGKVVRLQQGKRVIEEELEELRAASESLKKKLSTLQREADRDKGIHEEKEDMIRKLEFQCEESQQDSARHLDHNKKSEELLEHYRCEIMEYNLKHRNLRMRFENQLHQLIEQHKNLHSVFTPEKLPQELANGENTNRQLLSAEQLKLAQLQELTKELEEAKKQKHET